MPSSIFFNGQQRFRPSVYARVINNLSEQAAPATGNIALVGDFPQLKASTPVRFANRNELTEYLRDTNKDLLVASEIMFKPLQEDASINSLTLVNAGQSTQAKADFSGLRIRSRLWGTDGNRLYAEIAANAADSSKFDLRVIEGSEEREGEQALGDGAIASLEYEAEPVGTEMFTGMEVEVGSEYLTITAKKEVLAGTVHQNPFSSNASPSEGIVTLTIASEQNSGATVFTVEGLDLAGNVDSETLNVPDGTAAGSEFVTTKSFSSVTSVTAPDPNTFVGALTVEIVLFTQELSTITSLEATLNTIAALSDEVTGTFDVEVPAGFVSGSRLDSLGATSVFSQTAQFTTNRATIIDWFNRSSYVEAVELSNQPPNTGKLRLSGGSRDTAISSSEWQASFDSIKRLDINIVVPFTDAIGVHKVAAQHAIDAAEEAGYERNVWVGTSSNQTIQQAYASWSRQLNDRNVAVTPQSIVIRDNVYDPRFTACLLAGIQGATPISEPMTRKRPSDLIQGTKETFDREEEASLAIRRGLVILANPNSTGLRVERSVTTWLRDDNPVYSEVSANESVNQSIRILRSVLQDEIGTKVTLGRAASLKAIAQRALDDQRVNGIIKDFRDLAVTLEGDVANIVYSVAAIEPLNFITVTANVVR